MALDPNQYAYIVPPTVQLLSRNGKPLTGGHVEFYVTGTSSSGKFGTRYITYQNWDGGKNPFEIPIDMEGRFVALGWTGQRYDMYVYDSYGNMVFSRLRISINQGDMTIMGDRTSVAEVEGETRVEQSTSEECYIIYTVGLDPELKEKIDDAASAEDLDKLSERVDTAEDNISILEENVLKARTEVVAGRNVSITERIADDGHSIYTINASGGGGEGGFALIEANEIFGSQRMSDSKYNLIYQTISNNEGLALIASIGDNTIVFSISTISNSGLKFFSVNERNITVVTISNTSAAGFHGIDVQSIPVSGGGSTYDSGNGIYIDSENVINVLAGNGLEFDDDNKLQVKLGKGLKFDTEAGIEGEISIDDVAQEVIEEVQELANDLDKKITTTFNYAQIKAMQDFAPFGVPGTTRLLGQIFAVPIATEIRLNDTIISVRALQSYNGKVSFGIFEFDFDGNEGTGSTTWVCDTGVVSVTAGENQFKVKHIKTTSVSEPVIKMTPGKLYYATILIANDAPATGLYLAADDPYEANYNATPKYTMIASNMDNYVDWTTGSQEATWFQGYNEFHEVPRLFMMIRNGEAAPVPTVDPFRNYETYTLESPYKVSDVFSLELTTSNYPVLYQKIIPQEDVTIKKIGWCDKNISATYEYGTDIPIILNNEYTGMVNFADTVETATLDFDHGLWYHEFQLNTPISLSKGVIYWIPACVRVNDGADEPLVTYSIPQDTTKDLVLFQSKWNISQWAIIGGNAEYKNTQPATMCRVITDDDREYTF